MSKRFTETNKWCNPWFRKLDPKRKLLWVYLTDNCDQAGVIEIDWELATFQIGTRVCAKDLDAFEGRVATLPKDKLWIRTFVQFQYGKISRECKPHNPVFAALDRHGLTEADLTEPLVETGVDGETKGNESLSDRLSKGMPKAIEGVIKPSPRVEEEEEEKEKEKENARDPILFIDADVIYAAYPRKQGRQDAIRAIAKAMTKCEPEKLLSATVAYAAAVARWPEDARKFVPHPATWFNGGGYEDDPKEWERGDGRKATLPTADIYTEPFGWQERAKRLWPDGEIPKTWFALSSTARLDLIK